ncbi:hypothetical protein DPMN_085410 [Dreissena polymorpha]|uniref:Uncharacterized protein n=1 Tax=Dreissena polymorpha TaxID=45954 RepID=A0A9D4BLV7_DREPO|nr:hypothetical protein DPMN_085410 [Dreissena polymorpha]
MFVLHVFSNDDSAVEDWFHCYPPSSVFNMGFRKQIFGFTFQSVEGDAYHNFDGMADVADGAVIPALLEISCH